MPDIIWLSAKSECMILPIFTYLNSIMSGILFSVLFFFSKIILFIDFSLITYLPLKGGIEHFRLPFDLSMHFAGII